MSLVAAFAYKDGHRTRELSLSDPSSLDPGVDDFVWIGVANPSEQEMEVLQRAYGLHPLAVEDALRSDQLPKADVYGEQVFVLAKTAFLEDSQIRYGQTAIFVGRRHLITVRQGSARAHTDLRRQLEASPGLLGHGVDYILHAVLDFIVDGYPSIIEGIEEEVASMERRALDAFLSRGDIIRIFNMRRDLSKLERMTGPMQETAKFLQHHDVPCIDSNVKPYFRDVADHVRRAGAMAGALREVLSTVFEASTLLEQQRQGAITRQLAAWAAILAVPTAIAGIYGMNFDHMPELRWAYGYYAVLAVVVGVCLYLYRRFKRSGWL